MNIDRNEVLRYLGHRGQTLDDALSALIDDAIAQCMEVARPKSVYRIFDLDHHPECGEIRLAGTTLVLRGNSILGHLARAKKAAVLAATLGAEIETRIRMYERVDMTRSLVLDAAATEAIEKTCDTVEAEIRQLAAGEGLHANFRFSPGYGDLSLELQPVLLGVLDAARKIGLTCTENLILLPRKSVTAIIGLLPESMEAAPYGGCGGCDLRGSCSFQRCQRPANTQD